MLISVLIIIVFSEDILFHKHKKFSTKSTEDIFDYGENINITSRDDANY